MAASLLLPGIQGGDVNGIPNDMKSKRYRYSNGVLKD